MAYTKTTWEDLPSEDTPIIATALQNIEDGIEALDTAYSGLLNFFYPVGTIYETTSTDLDTTTKMATHFGGTWEVYGDGRVLVAKSADTEFDTIGHTGGSKEMQSHSHNYYSGIVEAGYSETYPSYVAGARPAFTHSTVSAGSGVSGNLQPYIVVYRYRRTA